MSQNKIRLVYCYDPPIFYSLALMRVQSQADDCIKSRSPLSYSKSSFIFLSLCSCVWVRTLEVTFPCWLFQRKWYVLYKAYFKMVLSIHYTQNSWWKAMWMLLISLLSCLENNSDFGQNQLVIVSFFWSSEK